MPHIAKIIETKDVADGILAVKIRCCNDPLTDSWHTLHDIGKLTAADIDAWAILRKQAVRELHEAKIKTATHLQRLVEP